MTLFISSEVFPYAKTGGLADVSYALPKALAKDIAIKTVMPLYNSIDRAKHGIISSGISFEKTLGGITHQFDIYFQDGDISKVFLYNPILCDRLGLYEDDYGEFGDNDLRFGLLSYASLELISILDLPIDTLHINDWQTSLVALLAKEVYNLDAKVVLTIHNLAYQGVFDKSVMQKLDLDWERFFKPDRFEYYDRVNYLKAGIFYADAITTVSQKYAQEIQTPQFGEGLDLMLRLHSHKLQGVPNGIDTQSFNPATDAALYKNYDSSSYSIKNKNKKKLCKELGIKGYKKPLFVFIGRLTWQKGVECLIENIHAMSELDANFIFLGSGEARYEDILIQATKDHDNIHVEIGYNETLSRRLYSASDFLLMPSKFEPCGLNQMIAMAYGSIPIVTHTGGLSDTVTDINHVDSATKGQGIVLFSDSRYDVVFGLAKALSLFAHKKRYASIALHNMQLDFSWKQSAKTYLKIYQK